ncbi:pre-mRNA-splicing factor SYF1 [Trifolium repens]|nr:pre-mRNA-splicing factor SYF1 [Trifolium repens]
MNCHATSNNQLCLLSRGMEQHLCYSAEHKYFEDAFKVYERGVKIFKYPHVKDIWVTYISKFVKRYGKTKLERARELFENAVETVSCVQLRDDLLSMLLDS